MNDSKDEAKLEQWPHITLKTLMKA